MRDILTDIDRWREEGESIAIATVVETWGSAPRDVGAKMALTDSGRIAGSVSGGCIEGAVAHAAEEVLTTGKPQLLHFGVTNEKAWEVGLACGGTIEVFVKALDPALYDPLRAALREERPIATATVIRGPDELLGRELLVNENGKVAGTLGSALDETAARVARDALAQGRPQRQAVSPAQGPESHPLELFIDVLLPSPTLIAVGGVHIAIALTALAKTLGYRTIVVDPRRAFGSPERFPHADQLIQAWPDEALAQIGLTRTTAVAVLTHDPKLDDPALKVALPSPAFYVGALGSRRTHEKRCRRLLEEGVTEDHLARLHAPIGLEIGARTPEEIALAIMAQVVEARNRAREL
jgi:xanthine dehydrogenase accessory factor